MRLEESPGLMVLSFGTGDWEGLALEGEDEGDNGSEILELVAEGDDGAASMEERSGCSVWRLA